MSLQFVGLIVFTVVMLCGIYGFLWIRKKQKLKVSESHFEFVLGVEVPPPVGARVLKASNPEINL